MNLLLLIAILPVILLCYYIYKKDVDKEPKNLLRRVFIFGMISVIPIVLLELISKEFLNTEDTSDLIKLFAATFMGVAFIEETAKWAVIHIGVYNNKEFNHPYDAIVYAVYSSLGFAVVENIMYVVTTNIKVGLSRGLITVPSHACDAIIMGYFLSQAKQEEYKGNLSASKRYMTLSLLMPITVHALYDFLLFTGRNAFIYAFILYVPVVYIICFLLVKKVSAHNKNFDGTNQVNVVNTNINSNINPNLNVNVLTNPNVQNASVLNSQNVQNVNMVYMNNIQTNTISDEERKKISSKSTLYALFVILIITALIVISAIILSNMFLK